MSCGSNVKTGLACAGGVVEGAVYEIGALCALEEAVEGLAFNELDVYVGVSSGALIASCLANGVSPRTLSQAVVSTAEDPTLNMTPDVLFTPAVGEFGRRLQRAPSALLGSLKKYLSSPLDLSPLGALAELGPLLPAGLFDSDPLERYLREAFTSGGRRNDFRELGACLRVAAMHLDTAELVVFGEAGYDHVPISKAVQASTALPILYCPVEIDGAYYVDGVARRTVHASVALEAGTELLFCINPIVPINLLIEDRLQHHLDESLVEHGLPAVLSQTFRALVHSRMRTGFQRYAHLYPEADVLLIQPDFEDRQVFFSNLFSFSNRRAVCEHAYQATRQYLRARRDEIQPKLERHGLKLCTEVLEDEERRLFDGSLPQRRSRAKNGKGLDTLDEALDRLDGLVDRLSAEHS